MYHFTLKSISVGGDKLPNSTTNIINWGSISGVICKIFMSYSELPSMATHYNSNVLPK